MCGIAGFVGQSNDAALGAMAQAMSRRGPDGSGFHRDPANGVFLAHRRLAILDLPGGWQPMWNEDETVCIIFNGEIYNHLELRDVLRQKGHVFRSDHSDTEVLVHGYEEWGEDLPLKLSGMFAFVIYDVPRKSLFLARDRFGKKPLYYTKLSGFFAFASELSALRKHPATPSSIDLPALQKYFAYGYIPAPHSLYQNVYKLPGGYWLRYDITTERCESRQYWQFSIEPDDSLINRPEEELAEELLTHLRIAVKRRLISDVPLGFFLSGGIDSSTIVALAAQCMPTDLIQTYSIGFREPSFDESAFARQVAQHCRTTHHERVFGIDDAKNIAPIILAELDEPMGDSSILPTAMLSQFAREHVTVALGGDGGDELFAGYDPIRALAPALWYNRVVPEAMHRGMKKLADWLPGSERNMSLQFRLQRTLRGLSYPPCVWNPVWMSPLEPAEITDLLETPVNYETLYEDAISAWRNSKATSVLDRSLEFYTRFYLQDDILTKVDRAAMRVSLEVRAPFLDNDVAAFAAKLPARFKYYRGHTKHLLKTAASKLLPSNIVNRGKKGFGIPLTAWLKNWRRPPTPAFLPPHNDDWLAQAWRQHCGGSQDQRLFMWCWLTLSQHPV